MKWDIISSEYLTQHPPYFISRKDVCRRPDGTIIPAYYVVELPPSVIVFPMLDKETVLMVKQYRHPVQMESLELPGGFIDNGETVLEAASRELLEETGYTFSTYKHLGRMAANPGVLNNFTEIFLATDPVGLRSQQLDSNEDIRLQTCRLDEIFSLITNGVFIQSLHINACFLALAHVGMIETKKID